MTNQNALTGDSIRTDTIYIEPGKGIKPIKGLSNFPLNIWEFFSLGLLVTAAVAIFLVFFKRRRTVSIQAPPSAFNLAKDAFFALVPVSELSSAEEIRLYYSTLDGILRSFLKERLLIDAPHSTRTEIVLQLKLVLQENEVLLVSKFLQQVDSLKFSNRASKVFLEEPFLQLLERLNA